AAGGARPVWIAASTHEGEELVVLKAHAAVLRRFPDALLLIAPRHPERFKPVALACRAYGFQTATRSENGGADTACQCFVADSMGELITFYAAADVAFVGGSLAPVGGHNLLEPAALARPILVGPHNFNAPDIARMFLENGGALQVSSAEELATPLLELFDDPDRRQQLGALS